MTKKSWSGHRSGGGSPDIEPSATRPRTRSSAARRSRSRSLKRPYASGSMARPILSRKRRVSRSDGSGRRLVLDRRWAEQTFERDVAGDEEGGSQADLYDELQEPDGVRECGAAGGETARVEQREARLGEELHGSHHARTGGDHHPDH